MIEVRIAMRPENDLSYLGTENDEQIWESAWINKSQIGLICRLSNEIYGGHFEVYHTGSSEPIVVHKDDLSKIL